MQDPGNQNSKPEASTLLELSEDELVFGSIQNKIQKIYEFKNKTKEDNTFNDYQASELLSQIGKNNWHLIDISKVKIPTVQKKIVEGLTTFKHISSLASTLSKILSKCKKVNDGYESYYGSEIYKYMDLEQLESVSSAINTFDSYYVHMRRFEIIFFDFYHPITLTQNEEELFELFRKFKVEVDSRKSGFTKKTLLGSIGGLISGQWDPYLGVLSRLLTKCLLLNTVRRERYEEQLFWDYLDKPVVVPSNLKEGYYKKHY